MRKLKVTNSRAIGGSNIAHQKVAFMSFTDGYEVNTTILKNDTKDINLPSPKSTQALAKPFMQIVVMRTHSASAEPTIVGDHCEIIGCLSKGTVRYTIIKIDDAAPDEIAITVVNK